MCRQTNADCCFVHTTAESEGNVDNFAYTYVPDMKVPLVRPPLGRLIQISSRPECLFQSAPVLNAGCATALGHYSTCPALRVSV